MVGQGKELSIGTQLICTAGESKFNGGQKQIKLLGMKSLDNAKKIFAVQDGHEFTSDIADILAIFQNPSIKQIHGTFKYLFEKNMEFCDVIGCDTLNNCGAHAYCKFNEEDLSYKCECNEGFFGDGFSCYAQRNCHIDPSMCDPHAVCLSG
nr:unnamed protein product [Callosobruchus analis]